MKKTVAGNNNLGIVYGVAIIADNFKADLVKLAEPAGLRLFVAEHRPFIIQLQRLAEAAKAIFNVGAGNGRRSFGTQSERVPALAADNEHLLLNNIGGLD